MSHGKIREEKNCLNCGHQVEERYCTNCGQENTINRKPFHYLFTHFVEDFTHYDGQFWGTIYNLLFKPGKLTETYLAGKRKRFVPPVKLYIFISFITFFLFALFPPFHMDFGSNKVVTKLKTPDVFAQTELVATQQILDSIKSEKNLKYDDSVAIEKVTKIVSDSSALASIASTLEMNKKIDESTTFSGYKNRKSYDSAQVKNPSALNFITNPIAHKFFELKDKGLKKGEIIRNLAEISFHNLPKALFLYLPIFALFLWIFHNKKKWWYFDHGVFTLHYFAFLLLNILLSTYLFKAADLIRINFFNTILYLIFTGLIIYSILYFFIAHRRIYHAHGLVSFIIGLVLFTVNFFAFLFLAVGLGLVSFLQIN